MMFQITLTVAETANWNAQPEWKAGFLLGLRYISTQWEAVEILANDGVTVLLRARRDWVVY